MTTAKPGAKCTAPRRAQVRRRHSTARKLLRGGTHTVEGADEADDEVDNDDIVGESNALEPDRQPCHYDDNFSDVEGEYYFDDGIKFHGKEPEVESDKESESEITYNPIGPSTSSNGTEQVPSSNAPPDLDLDMKGSAMFDLMSKQMNEYAKFCEANDGGKELLTPDSPLTVSEFLKQLQGIVSSAGLEDVYVKQLLGLLKRALPNSNIPSRLSARGNVVSDMSKYTPPSKHLIEMDACVNDCHVFTDPNEKDCPRCKVSRYYENSKYNRKSIFYRPITAIIMELLTHADFQSVLHYRFVRPSSKSKYQNMDVLDGANAKRNLAEMRNCYNQKRGKDDVPNDVIEISLLVSLFYDGIQLYRKKVINYWPLFCTVLNLPPALRTKVGGAIFLLTSFYGKLDSPSEIYLFEDCLIAELRELRKGCCMNVDGVNYFVQVRCISHIWDTKALGKQLHCQEVGSKVGCPLCTNMQGVSKIELSKVVYKGHRQALAMDHFLRTRGHSTQCCPPRSRDHFNNAEEYNKFLGTIHNTLYSPEIKDAVTTILRMRDTQEMYPRGLTVCPKWICCPEPDFDMKNFAGRYNSHCVHYRFSFVLTSFLICLQGEQQANTI